MTSDTTKRWSPIAAQLRTHITQDAYDLYVQLPWWDDDDVEIDDDLEVPQ